MRAATVLISAILYAGGVQASEPPAVVPGDGTVNGTHIVPYDNAWSVVIRKTDGTVLHDGVATDHVAFKTIDGKKYLLRVEGQVEDDGSPSETSITISDPVTLAPHAGEKYPGDGSVLKHEYAGTHFTVRTLAAPGAKEEIKQFELPQSVFDFRGNMTGLILRSLPLAPGYAARIPWADDSGTIHQTEIRVLRRETIDAGLKGRVQTWAVAVGAAPSHVTYWISDAAPYVIRCDIASGDEVTSWIMIR
jgi:hypothetical protein